MTAEAAVEVAVKTQLLKDVEMAMLKEAEVSV